MACFGTELAIRLCVSLRNTNRTGAKVAPEGSDPLRSDDTLTENQAIQAQYHAAPYPAQDAGDRRLGWDEICRAAARQGRRRYHPDLDCRLLQRRRTLQHSDSAGGSAGAASRPANDPDFRDRYRRTDAATGARRQLPAQRGKEVPPELLDRYFFAHENNYVLVQNIWDMVRVSSHNLIKDPPFSHVDLIVCRNLLIYFNARPAAAANSGIPLFAAAAGLAVSGIGGKHCRPQ
jgi:hypothetical protein